MKPFLKKSVLALAVSSVLGLAACVDTNQTVENKETLPDSVLVSKSSSGVITGFGSVFINGVEYETDDAQFVVDGVAGDESLLKLGMVVSLSGSAAADGTGNALSIEFDNDVEGVVIENNIGADGIGTLNIMGVTVNVDEDTVFESKVAEIVSLTDIAAGNIIEVSGHSSGDGNVWATRLEVKSLTKEADKEMEVKGTISMLDELANTFVIGTLTVDYSGATLKDGFAIANDIFVEVKSKDGINSDTGFLIAHKIELEDGGKKSLDHDDDVDEVELEGVITKVISLTEIEVNGHAVLLSDTTKYVHGSAAIAAEGMKIKIKGDVNADGKLVAEKVIFKPSGDLRLAGKISATDMAANTISIFGVAISLNNSTLVKDDRDHDELANGDKNIKYKFGVDDLAVGDWIKVKAYTNKDGGLTATKMIRKTVEQGKLEKLEGKLALDTTTSIYYVAGIKLDLTSVSDITPVDGKRVELKGTYENGTFTVVEGETKADEKHYIGGKDADEDDLDKDDDHEDDDDHDDDKEDDDHDSENKDHEGHKPKN